MTDHVAVMVYCRRCGKRRRHYALGLCKGCYQWEWEKEHGHPRSVGFCTECNKFKQLVARGMCSACYQRDRRRRKKNADSE